MTTVLNPNSTPVIAFNSSGKNIQNLSGGVDGTFANATEIPHISEFTVAIVDGGAHSFTAVYFDSAFQIGDYVVVLLTNGSIANVYASDGSGLTSVVNWGGGSVTVTWGHWIKTGTGVADWSRIA